MQAAIAGRPAAGVLRVWLGHCVQFSARAAAAVTGKQQLQQQKHGMPAALNMLSSSSTACKRSTVHGSCKHAPASHCMPPAGMINQVRAGSVGPSALLSQIGITPACDPCPHRSIFLECVNPCLAHHSLAAGSDGAAGPSSVTSSHGHHSDHMGLSLDSLLRAGSSVYQEPVPHTTGIAALIAKGGAPSVALNKWRGKTQVGGVWHPTPSHHPTPHGCNTLHQNRHPLRLNHLTAGNGELAQGWLAWLRPGCLPARRCIAAGDCLLLPA
jgi:hypothetical protein